MTSKITSPTFSLMVVSVCVHFGMFVSNHDSTPPQTNGLVNLILITSGLVIITSLYPHLILITGLVPPNQLGPLVGIKFTKPLVLYSKFPLLLRWWILE